MYIVFTIRKDAVVRSLEFTVEFLVPLSCFRLLLVHITACISVQRYFLFLEGDCRFWKSLDENEDLHNILRNKVGNTFMLKTLPGGSKVLNSIVMLLLIVHCVTLLLSLQYLKPFLFVCFPKNFTSFEF